MRISSIQSTCFSNTDSIKICTIWKPSPNFMKNRKIDILHNCLILYFILFLSVINLVSYGLVGNFFIPTLFILIGLITSFFSKNMTVILTISLITSNIIKYGIRIQLNEGMEGKAGKESKESKESKEVILDDKNDTITSYEKQKDTKITKSNKIEGMQEQYKELMTLQDKILGNIGSLEESLNVAEGIVNKIGLSIEKLSITHHLKHRAAVEVHDSFEFLHRSIHCANSEIVATTTYIYTVQKRKL